MVERATSAVRLPERQVAPQTDQQSRLRVVSGSGRDALRRHGVGIAYLNRIKSIVAIMAVVLVVACIRIALATACAQAMYETTQLRHSISQEQAKMGDLEVAHSLLSSNRRINEIATQQYDMKSSGNPEIITLKSESAQAQSANVSQPQGKGSSNSR